MDLRIRLLTIAGALAMLLFVVELVRRRKLKEEYSVLWVLTGLVLLVLSVWYGLLEWITQAVGAVVPASTLFFFGLLFVMAMLLHFSVRISALERRTTAVIQEIGLMRVHEPERPDSEDEPVEQREPASAAGATRR